MSSTDSIGELVALPVWLREKNIRRGAIRAPLANGALESFKIAKAIYLRRAQAEDWLSAQRRPPKSPPLAGRNHDDG